MKRTISVVYTIFVIVALVGILAFFGWKTYQSRAARIADLETRADDYTRRITQTLTDERDVKSEVALAEKIMADDPSLVLVQVSSRNDGLRLSVAKPEASEFNRVPYQESGAFSGPIAALRYHKVSRELRIEEMQGMEAIFLAATLSGAEIRGYLMIILITVVGLFAVTLVMILVTGRNRAVDSNADDEDISSVDTSLEDEADDDFSLPDDFGDSPNDDFDFSEPDNSNRLDENDLLSQNPEIGEAIDFDDDFDLPELDDETSEPDGFFERLDLELERTASFNQDLSLILFSAISEPGETPAELEQSIRHAFPYKDLVFDFGKSTFAVIELNKDLDSSLAAAEDFVRERILRVGNRAVHVGIASRNGRLISAVRLNDEAQKALERTDASKNIVAFRSDPEKYREYIGEQED